VLRNVKSTRDVGECERWLSDRRNLSSPHPVASPRRSQSGGSCCQDRRRVLFSDPLHTEVPKTAERKYRDRADRFTTRWGRGHRRSRRCPRSRMGLATTAWGWSRPLPSRRIAALPAPRSLPRAKHSPALRRA